MVDVDIYILMGTTVCQEQAEGEVYEFMRNYTKTVFEN